MGKIEIKIEIGDNLANILSCFPPDEARVILIKIIEEIKKWTKDYKNNLK